MQGYNNGSCRKIDFIVKGSSLKMKVVKKIPFLYSGKVRPPESGFQELKLKSGSLFDKRDAINKNLVRELKEGKIPSRECHTWLKQVEEIKHEVCELLKSEETKHSQSEIANYKIRGRLKALMKEIAEFLDNLPNKHDTGDDAMIGRSKSLKGSMAGDNEYRTVEVGKTNEIQRADVHSNAAAKESAPASKETSLRDSMQQNNETEMISAPLAAVSEHAETYRMEDGCLKAQKKIPLPSAFDQRRGETSETSGPEALRLEPRTISVADSPQKLPREENHSFLSRAGAGLVIPPEESEWEETEMIFLMDNDISKLPEKPNCPMLKRLLLQRNRRLTTIPASFFDNMPCLQVLNLSRTNIRSLPSSVFRLTKLQVLILRHCPCLSEIPPEIGNAKSVEILDLYGTEIYGLPDTIGKLSQLKHLHASFYGHMDDSKFHKKHKNLIPVGIISELQALEKLSILVQAGDTKWNTEAEFVAKDLSNLSKLDTISICFPEVKYLNTFIGSSPAWKACTLRKFKFVIGHDIKRSASLVPKYTELDYDQEIKCLRYVNTDMDHIPNEVKEILKRATAFYLDHQSRMRSLTEFGIENIRELKLCIVSECSNMESIVDGSSVSGESALPNLSHLSLHYLWNLKNICNGEIPAESFNALKVLSVHTCPRLEFVFSWSMLQHFAGLEELVVEDCASVTEIIKSEMKIEVGAAELPRLKRLKLHYLPQLLRICNGSHQKIEHLTIQYCPKLESN